MSTSGGEPLHPRAQRRRRMVRFLWISAAVVGLLATATLAVPAGEVRDALGVAAVAALVLAPVLRVGWLSVRWLRLGDPRFAAVAAGLLLVVALAALVG
jgi:hypothetical protein